MDLVGRGVQFVVDVNVYVLFGDMNSCLYIWYYY